MHKKKEVVQDVALYDLDVAHLRSQGREDILSIMGSIIKLKLPVMIFQIDFY